MSQIKVLDPITANQIAAGEVVERPASVVKELCENAIDAEATHIKVEILQGGIEYIAVTDDGKGMDKEDLILAFEPHATSKIKDINDLLTLQTKGFRGEALASIASVSRIHVRSKAREEENAYQMDLEAGVLQDFQRSPSIAGTKIQVKDLFFNTPARYKFLKKDATEADKVREVVLRLALAHPNISFEFFSNQKLLLQTPGNASLEDTVYALFGQKFLSDLISLQVWEEENLKIYGLIGQPEAAKRSRTHQFFYVNQRFVKSPTLSSAMDQVYQHRLMKGLYPSCILFVELSGDAVDVNVHPQKLEVRFSDAQNIFQKVYHTLEKSLEKNTRPPYESASSYERKYQSLYADFFEKKEVKEMQAEKTSFADVQEDLSPKEKKELSSFQSKDLVTSFVPKNDVFSSKIEKIQEPAENYLFSEEQAPLLSKAEHERQFSQKQEHFFEVPKAPLKQEQKRKLSSLKYVGSAFSTFLILEEEETLWLIDQHAAHEKILFEKFYKEYQNFKTLSSQTLLLPIEMHFSKTEIKTLEEQKSFFEKTGLHFELFSDESILLRSVPFLPEAYLPVDIFHDVFAFLQAEMKLEKNKSFDAFFYDFLAEVSCKAAIKANQNLSELEIKTLLDDVENLENAYHCPHGRPLIIQITKKELEKRFKRIL